MQKFATKIKDIRPLLLIFDGHLSHLSLETIEFAMEEGLSILFYFPLKLYYEQELTKIVYDLVPGNHYKKVISLI